MRNYIKIISFCCLLLLALPAYSQVSVDIHLGSPPPPPHEVIIAAPDPAAIWVPGYYVYDPRVIRYVWVPGAWQHAPRPNTVWIAPRYERHRGQLVYIAGRWGAKSVSRGSRQHAERVRK